MHKRLIDLLTHQGLPTQPAQDLLGLLEPVQPLEYSVHSHRVGVGAMINGDGLEHCARVLRVMAHFGCGGLGRARAWMNRFEGRRVFLKVDLGRKGPKELSLYFRRRAPVETVLQWLRQDGLDQEGLLCIAHTAQILGCPNVHFVAQSWGLNAGTLEADAEHENSEHKLYFAQPPGRPGWLRTLSWLPTRSVPKPTIARFRELELQDAQRFASIRLGPEGLKDGAKLDIAEPSPELVGLLSATDAPGQGRLHSLMLSGPIDYLAWDVTAGAQGVGLYSTRR